MTKQHQGHARNVECFEDDGRFGLKCDFDDAPGVVITLGPDPYFGPSVDGDDDYCPEDINEHMQLFTRLYRALVSINAQDGLQPKHMVLTVLRGLMETSSHFTDFVNAVEDLSRRTAM